MIKQIYLKKNKNKNKPTKNKQFNKSQFKNQTVIFDP